MRVDECRGCSLRGCLEECEKEMCSVHGDYSWYHQQVFEKIAALKQENERLKAQLAKSCGDEWDDRFDFGTPCSTAWGIHNKITEENIKLRREIEELKNGK
jgi:hypothetical protein